VLHHEDDQATGGASMTPNSDWWDRAKQPPRPQAIDIRKRETIVAGALQLVREPCMRAC
jgi:hypothetical protein